jgi:kumamolisin
MAKRKQRKEQKAKMASNNDKARIPLKGSERQVLPQAKVVGAASPQERIEVTVILRPRSSQSAPSTTPGQPHSQVASPEQLGTQLPAQRQYLSRAEFEVAYGADPQAIAQVEEFAHEHGLDVVEASPARRSIVLSGTVEALSQAFGIELHQYDSPQGRYRGRTGPIYLPPELAPVVEGVFGLDNRPQARTHFRIYQPGQDHSPASQVQSNAVEARAVNTSYTPLQLARLYDFPSGLNGQGQTIAIIELGGGYRTSDLKAYFNQLGLATPKISAVSVDGGHNQPTGQGSGPDGEVMLDIEVAGAIAPAAKIVVYFAPNTDRGFLDAITTAIHDNVRKPSIISISWGGPESSWTAQALQSYNQAFADASRLGVTICCASGDSGSSDGVNDGKAHVDFPASSPYVLACGGTRLDNAGGNSLSRETVWNEGTSGGATGGGVSETFPLPTWQQGVKVPPSVNSGHFVGRGLPDVAGDADPATGYIVRVDGQQAVIGGTSAVAPLWAGLLALFNQHLGHPVGYLNPLLYGKLAQNKSIFHDITSGNNGAYQASAGWDACTGWGSPDGAKLLTALSG